jgi:hypothetical protein
MALKRRLVAQGWGRFSKFSEKRFKKVLKKKKKFKKLDFQKSLKR